MKDEKLAAKIYKMFMDTARRQGKLHVLKFEDFVKRNEKDRLD